MEDFNEKENQRIIKTFMYSFEELKKKEEETKKLKHRLWFLLFELFVAIFGFTILIYNLGWIISFGIWLVLWSNNLLLLRQVGEENKIIDFWKKDKK